MEHSLLETSEQFFDALCACHCVKERLRLCLDRLRYHVEAEGAPELRQFWEVRTKCLELFKEKIPPRIRILYWAELVSLSDQARKAQKVVDAEAAFAVEQIELAILALKREIEGVEEGAAGIFPIDFPESVRVFGGKREQFIPKQQEVDFLGNLAQRLNSLRKELIRIPMRARVKSRLLGELSALSDGVFPRRKEGICALSERFLNCVNAFAIDPARLRDSKEEIKAIQAFAKAAAIDAQTFNASRETLSRLWDQIRELEKEYHAKRVQERLKSKESREIFEPKIELLSRRCQAEKLSCEEAETAHRALLEQMRQLPLTVEDVKSLKKKLAQVTVPLQRKRAERLEKEEKERREMLEVERKAQEALEASLLELLDRAETLEMDALVKKWEACVKEGETLGTQGAKGVKINSLLDGLCDHIQEKRWRALKEDQTEGREHQLHTLLDDRHKACRKLKQRLEDLRKIVGGSGLSLEESLLYQEVIGEEKYRLDAIETMIEEIEERLFNVGE